MKIVCKVVIKVKKSTSAEIIDTRQIDRAMNNSCVKITLPTTVFTFWLKWINYKILIDLNCLFNERGKMFNEK